MTKVWLSGLYIYPIKSAAGIALSSAQVHSRGLEYDRRWMVVDSKGKFITQRKFPQMALIQISLESDHLAIAAPGMPPLAIPLQPPSQETRPVTIWKDRCDAVPVGQESQSWFSEFLQTPCQLVYMPDESDRPIHDPGGDRGQVSFADAYPFLLISEASLEDLNQRLAQPIPMNRFRPNLVVSGCEAFAEDGWQQIQVGEIAFCVAKPCARCIIPSVDQATGICGKEPLMTLAQYRSWDGQIWFGQNLIQSQLGSLQVGTPVEILSES